MVYVNKGMRCLFFHSEFGHLAVKIRTISKIFLARIFRQIQILRQASSTDCYLKLL